MLYAKKILTISFLAFIFIGALIIFLILKGSEERCPSSSYSCKSLPNKGNLTATKDEIQIDLSLIGEAWTGLAICEYYLIPEIRVEYREEIFYKVDIQQCKFTNERYSPKEIHKAMFLLRRFGIFQTNTGDFAQCTYYTPGCRYNPL